MGSIDEAYALQSNSYVGNVECSRVGTDIERLALRINLADIDEQFEKVIQKSLVFILRYLAKYVDHRKKLLELLGDVTRRLKRRPRIQLPVHELFVAYNDPENSTYLTNFSHMYIRLGYPRLPVTEQICLLPVLYASLTDNKPIVQRDVLLHLTLPIIGGVPADARNRLELELNELPVQRRFINEFYSLVLLLPYTFERHIRFDSPAIAIPEGFNAYDYSRVAHERFSAIRSPSDLEKYKVAIVQFYSRGFFPTDESIVPLLFADADSRHSVVSAANKEVRMLSVLVDWENEALLCRIFDWYLGRRREFDPKGLSDLRQPLSAGVRIKLGHFLLRSRMTLTGPLASDLIEAAMLSLKGVTSYKEVAKPLTTASSQQQQQSHLCPTHGAVKAEQSQQQSVSGSVAASVSTSHCAHHPGQSVHRRLANHGLDLLAHLLDNATSIPPDASIRALGSLIEFVYESTSDELVPARARGFELLSRFLSREPNYLLKDPSQLPRLFDVLSEDIAPDLKTAAAHCLRRLAFTFQEAQRQNYPALRNQLAKLERLLFENMERPDPISRLVAVHFAGIIYPPDHIPTRYLILQALGDKDQRVRNEARMVFSIFLDPNIANDIVYGRVKLPSFVEFVNHDTQHTRNNPFIDVERLIPVVQFIRLCLLAVKGGLTLVQEKEMIYETDDEIRYRINQNVRYLLSLAASSSTSGGSSTKAESCVGNDAATAAPHSGLLHPNPEQARRSIATYFRLINVVIFARCQSPWDSPEFPSFMEEVLINNARELAVEIKNVLDQINNLLLCTSRGANCRATCASIFSSVTMATEPPSEALQIAVGMLEKVPKGTVMVDAETSHHIQGVMIGVAYLLKHLHDKHLSPLSSNGSGAVVSNSGTVANSTGSGGKSKKPKKQESKNKQHLQSGITEAIEKFLKVIDAFLIRPTFLVDKPFGAGKEKSGHHQEKEGKNAVGSGVRYISPTVAQATVTTLLEAVAVLAQAGCLTHLPAGSTVPTIESSGALPSCVESKANLVARAALYLTLPPSPIVGPSNTAGAANEEPISVMAGHQRVWFATLRTLACFCTGEPSENTSNTANHEKTGDQRVSTHPHLMFIVDAMSKMVEVRDPALQLAVGAAMADALLGAASPYKGLWYERSYPLRVPPGAAEAAARSQAGRWLAERFVALLTHKPGQIKPPPAMLAVSLWALAMARRFAPPPVDLLPPELFINLLTENDETLQCMAASILGLIYDRNDEAARKALVDSLNKMIADGKRPNTSVFRELCSLAHQIGREDMSLSLVVLATTSPPPSVNASILFQPTTTFDGATIGPANCPATAAVTTPWLTLCAVACVGLVRRLGRSLAPALPRLVPRVFIRRYDMARPRIRNAMQKIWLGLILYATPNSASNGMTGPNASSKSESGNGASSPVASPATITTTWESGNLANVSVNTLASELVEANFNAILCEIKAQLGLTSTTKSKSPTSPSLSGTATATNPTPDPNLRDACCLATVALTEHPSAYKQFAAHLPSLLSGLLAMVDVEQGDDGGDPAKYSPHTPSPAEKAASAIQKLMIRALEDPSCRDVATGLLPRLLPILISRALSTVTSFSSTDTVKQQTQQPMSESRSLALDLLLAAARVANSASLKNALPQLTIAGLQSMGSITPNRVVSLMRPSAPPPHQPQWNSSVVAPPSTIISKEFQMAEVLRLCNRLIDENSLSQLVMPLVELVRAGGGTGGGSSATGGSRGTGANSAASVATATCIFLSHLALSSSTLVSHPSPQSKKEESDSDLPKNRLASPLSQQTGKLLAALLGALPNAGRHLDNLSRKTVQEEMAQAVALLLRFAKDTSVAKVFTRVRSWFMDTGAGGQSSEGVASGSGQWACVRVMHAIARCCPDLLFAHPGLTLPLIFINTQSEVEVLQLVSLPNGPSGVEPPSSSLTSMPFSPATALLDDDEEVNARRALWKETWREILPASHANVAAAVNSSTSVAGSNTAAADVATGDALQSHFCLPGGYSSSSVCPLADLLKPPLLATFITTLSEALTKSPSWYVRNQAALALLSVSAAIVSQPMFLLTTVASSMPRDGITSDCGTTMTAASTSTSAVQMQVPKTQSTSPRAPSSSADDAQEEEGNEEDEEAEEEEVGEDEEEEEEDDEDEEEEDEDDEEDEQDEEENEAVFLIWCELARVLTAALKETGSWSGKVYLLRTVRMLTQTALERAFNLDDPNNELINEMWSVLVRETRSGRAEHAGPSYQAEAFWALASFAETCGRDATGLTEAKEDDRLMRLLRLILPNGIPETHEQHFSSKRGRQSQFQISQDLSEMEQELAIKTVGVMWPLQTKQPHVDRFVDTLHYLLFLMGQGGWRIQTAALGSILAMFAKLRTEQGEELVKKMSESGGDPIEKLGLRELITRLKRCAENTKSPILREHALGAIASMLRHRAFVALIHNQLEELIQSYANSGTSTMRDWASALMKSL